MEFRKKPVIIEADIWDASPNALSLAKLHGWHVNEAGNVWVQTLEGPMLCKKGDWLIRGVKGEYYSCKPDIFEMTYERVE